MSNSLGLSYNWLNRKVNEITIEDALEGYYEQGVDFVCGNGKLEQLVTHPRRSLLKIIMQEEN